MPLPLSFLSAPLRLLGSYVLLLFVGVLLLRHDFVGKDKERIYLRCSSGVSIELFVAFGHYRIIYDGFVLR